MLLAHFVYGIVRGWIVGRAEAKAIPDYDKWFRLVASISASSFISFFGIFAVAGGAALANHVPPLTAFVSAIFSGAGAMAISVLYLWRRSPLTRGIPIVIPGEVAKAEIEANKTYIEPSPPR